MRRSGMIVAVAAMSVAVAARAAPAPRLVEAFTDGPVDKAAAVRIAPLSAKQAADPTFRYLANMLAQNLLEAGFNVVPPSEPSRFAVTLEYTATTTGEAVTAQGNITDPAYRSLIVTEFDISDAKAPKLVWQTLMDQGGVSVDLRSTLPALIKAGTPYYGSNKTARGMNVAAWCADHIPLLGTHISVVCSRSPDRPYQRIAAQTLGMKNDTSAPPGTSGGGAGGP